MCASQARSHQEVRREEGPYSTSICLSTIDLLDSLKPSTSEFILVSLKLSTSEFILPRRFSTSEFILPSRFFTSDHRETIFDRGL